MTGLEATERGPIKRGHRLFVSALTSRVYVVTSWRELSNGAIQALRKYDVTDDFDTIARAWGAEPPRERV